MPRFVRGEWQTRRRHAPEGNKTRPSADRPRLLSASRLAVHHNLPIHHSDIAQAFIQTKLDRPIFISFPKGVDIRSGLLESIQDKFPDSKLGIRLLRSLYGLTKMLYMDLHYWLTIQGE